MKLTLHFGENEDFNYEWQELVLTNEDGTETLFSSVHTDSDSPEDNTLSRTGTHSILRIIELVKANPNIEFIEEYHPESYCRK